MSKRWITAILVFFLAVNGLVVAGESATHASHDGPGSVLHALDHPDSNSFASPLHHDDCDGGHHDCHTHANSAPLSAPGFIVSFANSAVWPLSLHAGAVLSGREPPVPPPNTMTF
ncbi:hypothetical protein [Alloalcanivorax mobilis]|uniref:hypothetical protein n=1 Tax=Alloalcanivorax mobilis TaxID=2019569 RepID=UPI000B5B220F|nr:hypothetical protein [Alloalcanivorax mobilis]ASK36181.1 hypothetical protein CEK62_18225 [Alcanivorax sp. N3-2A]